jgi:hypothetical protein
MDAVFRTVPLFLSAFSATRVFASLPRPGRLSLGFNLASASRLSKDDDEDLTKPLHPFFLHRDRFAYLPPPGKIPRIGKAGALIGFHRLDTAVSTFEEDTAPIRVLLQSQAVPLRPQTSETLDKFVFRTLQKAGDG